MNWINHVKQYQTKHNLTFKDAMKQAKNTYGGKLVKTKEDEELYNKLNLVGSATVFVPEQMGYINNKNKKEIINTLTPSLNISRRNGKRVFDLKPSNENIFKIENGKIIDNKNNVVTIQTIHEKIEESKNDPYYNPVYFDEHNEQEFREQNNMANEEFKTLMNNDVMKHLYNKKQTSNKENSKIDESKKVQEQEDVLSSLSKYSKEKLLLAYKISINAYKPEQEHKYLDYDLSKNDIIKCIERDIRSMDISILKNQLNNNIKLPKYLNEVRNKYYPIIQFSKYTPYSIGYMYFINYCLKNIEHIEGDSDKTQLEIDKYEAKLINTIQTNINNALKELYKINVIHNIEYHLISRFTIMDKCTVEQLKNAYNAALHTENLPNINNKSDIIHAIQTNIKDNKVSETQLHLNLLKIVRPSFDFNLI